MKILIGLAALMMLAPSAMAGVYEFAFLSASGSITWTDKTGQRIDKDGDLFAELSGEDRKLATSPQNRVLMLNGMSKKGWDVIDSRTTSGEPVIWLKHEIASTTGTNAAAPATGNDPAASKDSTKVPLVFTGGHDTDPRDGGRPVVLVAAGLGVQPQVFRDAFSHVHPAGPGSGGPTDAEARQNKHALMDALGKYGITDEDINTVSNFYRYASWKGDLWKNTPAAGYATVANGKITGFVITTAGAGYTTPPTVTVQGMPNVTAAATLSFGKDLVTNGSIKEVTMDSGAKNP